MIKAWWLDSSDPYEADRLLRSAKKRHASWDWIRVEESGFGDRKEAKAYFLREIQMRPMFSDGKAAYCFGLPSFHADIAKAIGDIPSKVLLVIIAKPDRTTSLWKKFKSMSEEDVKVTEFEALSKTNAPAWVKTRAESLGLQMEEVPCRALVDIVGFDKGMLHNELLKLLHFGGDGPPSVEIVENIAHGQGMLMPFELARAMLARRPDVAQQYLERMLSKYSPDQVYSQAVRDFMTKLCFCISCSSVEDAKNKASSVMKRTEEKAVPYFSNVNAMYYAHKDAMSSGWSVRTAYQLLQEVIKAQLDSRMSKHSEMILRMIIQKIAASKRS